MERLKLEQMKYDAKENLEKYETEIRDYRKEYGNEYSGYLVYRLQMSEYYRGMLNALSEFQCFYENQIKEIRNGRN